jgi:undecaprenyl-diphosphatase
MDLFAAAFLGILQGLTEFLPVSSSAHLLLVPWFFHWQHEGLAFDVAVHIGTMVAILAFFWRDWIRLAHETILGLKEGNLFGNPDRRLAWFLIVGTLPAITVGLTLEKTLENHLRSPLITVFTLAGFGILLLVAEKKSKQTRTLDQFTWADSLWIGFSQALALVPGVSRSGITMTTALFRDSSRACAARFSFLLSTPVIAGAGILEASRFISALRHPVENMAPVSWSILGAGFACAAVSGFLCIRFFLRYIQSKSFTPFVIYRFLLAFIVLIYYFKQ